jgi:hypothetical protein
MNNVPATIHTLLIMLGELAGQLFLSAILLLGLYRILKREWSRKPDV